MAAGSCATLCCCIHKYTAVECNRSVSLEAVLVMQSRRVSFCFCVRVFSEFFCVRFPAKETLVGHVLPASPPLDGVASFFAMVLPSSSRFS